MSPSSGFTCTSRFTTSFATSWAASRETVVGDGLEQGTEMGPIQNISQFEKVKGFLDDGRQNGKVVAGGEVLKRDGYFIQPTIVRDIPDSARLVREEQFGPVLPVLPYSDIDEVIARANDTEFGLGGSVWSSDRDRAFEVAARIDAGTVWVNKHLDLAPDIPYAGAKQSGIGTEFGLEGLEEFTQATVINMAKQAIEDPITARRLHVPQHRPNR